MSGIVLSLHHSDIIAYNALLLCLIPISHFFFLKNSKCLTGNLINFNILFKMVANCDLLKNSKQKD